MFNGGLNMFCVSAQQTPGYTYRSAAEACCFISAGTALVCAAMSHSIFQFLLEQWTLAPPVSRADLAGKTVVITGANSGLGYEAAKHFCAMNPGRLVPACRSRARGEAAVSRACLSSACALWWALLTGSSWDI